jgi:hypothetical protein
MAALSFRMAVGRLLIRWAVGDSGLGRPRRVLRVWPVWERVARTIWPVVAVPGSQYGLMGIHFTHYNGDDFVLPDGTGVMSGDPVGEIHLCNSAFVRAMGERRGADKFHSLTMFRDCLQALAVWASQPDFPQPVVAFYGVSLLSRGVVRLGFTIRPRKPGLQTRLDQLFLDGLLTLYTAEGRERLSLGRTASGPPDEVWMSISELFRRYEAD